MNVKKWWSYAIGILIALGVGGLSGLLTMEAMARYSETVVKPLLTPPGWVFSVVWTILYILMGIGAARVWQTQPGGKRSRGLNLFAVQLIVNFFWSLLFFGAEAYGFSVLWLILLWVLVLLMTISFWKIDRIVGLLQIPYLLWLSLALYLNIGVWYLNS